MDILYIFSGNNQREGHCTSLSSTHVKTKNERLLIGLCACVMLSSCKCRRLRFKWRRLVHLCFQKSTDNCSFAFAHFRFRKEAKKSKPGRSTHRRLSQRQLAHFANEEGQRAIVEGQAVALQVVQRGVHGHLRQSVPATRGLLVATDGADTSPVEPAKRLQLRLTSGARGAVLDQVLDVLELLS